MRFAPQSRANLRICQVIKWSSRMKLHRLRASQVSVAQPYLIYSMCCGMSMRFFIRSRKFCHRFAIMHEIYFLYLIIFSQFSGNPISFSNCLRVRCGHCLSTLLISLVKPDLNILKSSALMR